VEEKKREWKRRKESEREESKKRRKCTIREWKRKVWKRREQNGRHDLCNKYGCRTVCALDTCQSSLHVLVTVCAVTGCLYAGVRRSGKDIEFWALVG
jgi:hypothetical protein